MSKIIVLGAGMVGSAIAIDLAKKHQITLSDISLDTLNTVKIKCAELAIAPIDVINSSELQKFIAPFDLVVCAVPGFLG